MNNPSMKKEAFLLGAGIGALAGGEKDKKTGETKNRGIGALRGAAADMGSGLGALGGAALGQALLKRPKFKPGQKSAYFDLRGFGDKQIRAMRAGALAGTLGGGLAGYHGAKALGPKYDKEKEEMKKESADFSAGFSKVAYVDPITVVGDVLPSGKQTNVDRAESHGEGAAIAAAARKKSLGHYLFNPHVKGPLSELGHRAGRRIHAGAAAAPISRGLVYGVPALVLGGKSGAKHVEKADKGTALESVPSHTLKDEKPHKKEAAVGDSMRHFGRSLGHRLGNLSNRDKKAVLLGGAAASAGLTGLAVGTAGMDASKDAHKQEAERLGRLAHKAKELRGSSMAGYLLNPSAHGPFSEAGTRLARRYHASAAERPYLTALVPGFGMIRGGKAGQKDADK